VDEHSLLIPLEGTTLVAKFVGMKTTSEKEHIKPALRGSRRISDWIASLSCCLRSSPKKATGIDNEICLRDMKHVIKKTSSNDKDETGFYIDTDDLFSSDKGTFDSTVDDNSVVRVQTPPTTTSSSTVEAVFGSPHENLSESKMRISTPQWSDSIPNTSKPPYAFPRNETLSSVEGSLESIDSLAESYTNAEDDLDVHMATPLKDYHQPELFFKEHVRFLKVHTKPPKVEVVWSTP
jgi:hypothetical protein